MIYIKEIFGDEVTVNLQISGILDEESMPTFEKVLCRHLDKGRKVVLHLEGLIHIDRVGKAFLRKYRNKFTMKGPSKFLKIEIGEDRNPYKK